MRPLDCFLPSNKIRTVISKVMFSKWIVHSAVMYEKLLAMVLGTRYKQPCEAHNEPVSSIAGHGSSATQMITVTSRHISAKMLIILSRTVFDMEVFLLLPR